MVQIVLSTSWAVKYGVTGAAKRLPHELRSRVIGGTFHSRHMCRDEFQQIHRGAQVISDVQRRQPKDWLALDDATEGWTSPHAEHWIQTNPYEGISDPTVIQIVELKIAEMCDRSWKP